MYVLTICMSECCVVVCEIDLWTKANRRSFEVTAEKKLYEWKWLALGISMYVSTICMVWVLDGCLNRSGWGATGGWVCQADEQTVRVCVCVGCGVWWVVVVVVMVVEGWGWREVKKGVSSRGIMWSFLLWFKVFFTVDISDPVLGLIRTSDSLLFIHYWDSPWSYFCWCRWHFVITQWFLSFYFVICGRSCSP